MVCYSLEASHGYMVYYSKVWFGMLTRLYGMMVCYGRVRHARAWYGSRRNTPNGLAGYVSACVMLCGGIISRSNCQHNKEQPNKEQPAPSVAGVTGGVGTVARRSAHRSVQQAHPPTTYSSPIQSFLLVVSQSLSISKSVLSHLKKHLLLFQCSIFICQVFHIAIKESLYSHVQALR